MMFRTMSVVILLVLAPVGCGAGTGTGASESKAPASAAATKTAPSVVSKPAVDTSQLKDAPAWALTTLDGKPVSSESLKGKVVLIDFWATWCGPCRMTIPHLAALHQAYKDKGFEVVGVSLDQQGPAVVTAFVGKQSIPYTVAMGNAKIVQDFGGVRGIPTAFIISQDGKIFRKIVGAVPREQYEKDVKALLGVS
jgi:thiol-disulfide isomerase/thioredoxin